MNTRTLYTVNMTKEQLVGLVSAIELADHIAGVFRLHANAEDTAAECGEPEADDAVVDVLQRYAAGAIAVRDALQRILDAHPASDSYVASGTRVALGTLPGVRTDIVTLIASVVSPAKQEDRTSEDETSEDETSEDET